MMSEPISERRPRCQLVLVVEPDDELRKQIETHLVLRGFFVMGASSAALANEMANENDFDAVIAALTRDGAAFDLMAKLREAGSIVGISMSTYGDSFEIFQSNAAGFGFHFRKPLDMDLLVTKLSSLSSPACHVS